MVAPPAEPALHDPETDALPPPNLWAALLSWLALAVLLAVGARMLDLQAVGRTLAGADPTLLVAALALRAALLPVDAWVQQGHLARLGLDLSLWTSLWLELAAMPLKLVMPAKSGSLSKPLWLARRRGLPLATGLGFLAVYKGYCLAGTLGWAGMGLGGPAGVGLLAAAVGGVCVAGWISRHPPTLPGRVGRWARAVALGGAPLDRAGAWRVVGPMVLVQAGQLAAGWLAFRALGLSLGPADFAWRYGLAGLVAALPGTPAGLGTREAVALVTMAGLLSPEQVVAGCLLATVVVQAWPALLGLPLVPRLLRELARRP